MFQLLYKNDLYAFYRPNCESDRTILHFADGRGITLREAVKAGAVSFNQLLTSFDCRVTFHTDRKKAVQPSCLPYSKYVAVNLFGLLNSG